MQILSVGNGTISNIFSKVFAPSDATLWKCLEKACFCCIFAVHLGPNDDLSLTTQKPN